MATAPPKSLPIDRPAAPSWPRWVVSGRTHFLSSCAVRASYSTEGRKNDKAYKELGLFSLKKKIEDTVSRAEMIAPATLEVEEARRIKREEILMEYNLWDDLAKSNASLTALAESIKVVNSLKDLRNKAEEAKLITQLADMDVINHRLFKQAYKTSVDVSNFLDRYEISQLLSGPFDKEGACMIITAGSEGITSELWAEKLLHMYTRWSEKYGCEGRVTEKCLCEGGGIRSATIEFETEYVYGYLSGEKGIHKMIRSSLDGSVVRETCSAGVDVIPLFLGSAVDIQINDEDVEISSSTSHSDEFGCAPGSVVNILHIPTGITLQCSGERSHFANKVKALNRLKAKLLVVAKDQGVLEVNKIKRDAVVIDINQEARRYMFRPHKSVQDVITGIQMPGLNSVLDGNIEPLVRAHISLRQGRGIDNNQI